MAGAPAAWDDGSERLIRAADVSRRALPADALLLAQPDADRAAAGPPRARILLLLGAGQGVERHDLLVPRPGLEPLHAALGAAAESLAGTAGGRWLARALAIAPDLASVALLPEDGQVFGPPVSIPATALLHDLPLRAGPDGLELGDAHPRVRLLLGTAPARLRIFLRGDAARAALFENGARLPATLSTDAAGEACLEAEPRSGAGAFAAIFGLAVPAPARVAITRLEAVP
jgi:hypothetical protein